MHWSCSSTESGEVLCIYSHGPHFTWTNISDLATYSYSTAVVQNGDTCSQHGLDLTSNFDFLNWMLSDIHFSLYPVGTTTLYSALLSGTTYIYYLVLMKFFATTSETMIFKALLLALRHGNFTSTLTQCLCGQAQAFVGWLEELSLASLWAGAHTLAPLEQ